MREEIFMNQEIINVTLLNLDERNDILRFSIDGENLDVNLNEADCQKSMKSLFSVLLKKAVRMDLSLRFVVAPEYERRMYVEVCGEYVKDLNRELHEVVDLIREECNDIVNL